MTIVKENVAACEANYSINLFCMEYFFLLRNYCSFKCQNLTDG